MIDRRPDLLGIGIDESTAIVVQGTLEPGGKLSLAPTNPYLWGAAAAAVAAWQRKSVLLTIAAGLLGLCLTLSPIVRATLREPSER